MNCVVSFGKPDLQSTGIMMFLMTRLQQSEESIIFLAPSPSVLPGASNPQRHPKATMPFLFIGKAFDQCAHFVQAMPVSVIAVELLVRDIAVFSGIQRRQVSKRSPAPCR